LPDRSVDLFDRKIQEVSDHLDRLKAIRQFMSEDPALVTEITKLVLSPEANGKIISPQSRGAESPHLAPIVKYLKTRQPDDWVSAKEIATATGIEVHNVYAVLDRKHPDLFEIDHPTPKRKYWRLRRDANE